MERANAWKKYDEQTLLAVEEAAKNYKAYLDAGKTERECAAEAIRLAKEAGYTDLKEAIASGQVSAYVTDFPTEETVGVPGIIAIPHLGASTEESEENCAVMAADQLIDFLENGNIKNSVNYPAVDMPRTDAGRLVILHRNIPNMISHVASTLAERKINIENMVNRSRGDFSVTLIDTYAEITADMRTAIESMEGIIKVIVIR